MNYERISEKDWKVFRDRRGAALERFCERVLEEIVQIKSDKSLSFYERYQKVCQHLDDRDQQMANMFSDPRRSQALMQLAGIYALNLLSESEFKRFSRETRESVQKISEFIDNE
jgi:hypothetical protein